MGKVIAACMFLAAQSYMLPPTVLMGIYKVEGGQVGQAVGPNDNGSYDLGPMQINTVWLPQLAEYWNTDVEEAKRWVRDDACVNVKVSAWILRQHLDKTGDLDTAIRYYHSRTPLYGNAYHEKVVSSLYQSGLVDKNYQ